MKVAVENRNEAGNLYFYLAFDIRMNAPNFSSLLFSSLIFFSSSLLFLLFLPNVFPSFSLLSLFSSP
jgi:hypothetical protein